VPDINSGNRIASGLFWKFAERIFAQVMTFIISIVLARMLLPEAYGMIAMVLIFINIANIFVSDGISTALIQKKDANELDFTTMFHCSFALSILFYLVIYLAAPAMESFFNLNDFKIIIRVISLQLPLSSLNSIQQAFVSRNMLFRKFFYSTVIGVAISGLIGIVIALSGLGVWALVAQYLVNTFINTIVLLIIIPWKPKLRFSTLSLKPLLSYGWKIAAGSLLNSIYLESRTLIIGKKYSSSDLAFYNRGSQFPGLFTTNIVSTIAAVLFPVFSNHSDNLDDLKQLTRKSMRLTCYCIFPVMTGLAAVAEPMVRILLTEKWIFCVPYLRIACLTQALQPVAAANLQMIKAIGRSDLYLKMEIIKKATGVAIILLAMRYGVYIIALSEILVVIFNSIVNIYPNKRLVNYGYFEQFKDILPSAILSGVMGIAVFSISFLLKSDAVTILLQVFFGVFVFLGISAIFQVESFLYVLHHFQIAVGRIKRRNDFN